MPYQLVFRGTGQTELKVTNSGGGSAKLTFRINQAQTTGLNTALPGNTIISVRPRLLTLTQTTISNVAHRFFTAM